MLTFESGQPRTVAPILKEKREYKPRNLFVFQSTMSGSIKCARFYLEIGVLVKPSLVTFNKTKNKQKQKQSLGLSFCEPTTLAVLPM